MEMVHAGKRGNVLSHKNRCLFRMMVSESDTFLCTFSGAGEQRGREGEKDERKEKVKQRRKRTKGLA